MTPTQPKSTLMPKQAAEQARILNAGVGFEAHQFACDVRGADSAVCRGGWDGKKKPTSVGYPMDGR